MENLFADTCRNCGSMKFKTREELTDDEKFIVERLSANGEVLNDKRKKQRFCKRCLYEMPEKDSDV